jgi:integrase
VPLLQAMRDECDATGPALDMPSERDLARGLRRWLTKAGVTRRELHASTRTTRAVRFHDLRASGITWMATRGDDPLKIMQRAGHTNFGTTQLYVRTAEAMREGCGEVFPPSPPRSSEPQTKKRPKLSPLRPPPPLPRSRSP